MTGGILQEKIERMEQGSARDYREGFIGYFTGRDLLGVTRNLYGGIYWGFIWGFAVYFTRAYLLGIIWRDLYGALCVNGFYWDAGQIN